mmetsp:Transcript_323/g.787  ORF Transcript_323/g.787 Transcript_323/m.787 type:complete len:233 (-) Transcript_323:140-838(-)
MRQSPGFHLRCVHLSSTQAGPPRALHRRRVPDRRVLTHPRRAPTRPRGVRRERQQDGRRLPPRGARRPLPVRSEGAAHPGAPRRCPRALLHPPPAGVQRSAGIKRAVRELLPAAVRRSHDRGAVRRFQRGFTSDHHHPDHQAAHRKTRPVHRGRRRDRRDTKRHLTRHHRVRRRGTRRGCVLTNRHQGRQELLRVRTADPVRGVWPALRQRHLHQQKLRHDRDDRGVREAVG